MHLDNSFQGILRCVQSIALFPSFRHLSYKELLLSPTHLTLKLPGKFHSSSLSRMEPWFFRKGDMLTGVTKLYQVVDDMIKANVLCHDIHNCRSYIVDQGSNRLVFMAVHLLTTNVGKFINWHPWEGEVLDLDGYHIVPTCAQNAMLLMPFFLYLELRPHFSEERGWDQYEQPS